MRKLSLKNFIWPSGRLSRREYWLWYMLPIYGIAIFSLADPIPKEWHIFKDVVSVILTPLGLLCLARGFRAHVCRLHDLDKRWHFFSSSFHGLQIAFTRGTIGPNQFGPDPLDTEITETQT